jgi:hypothetical protein
LPKITLPDGCMGVEFADGTKYDGRGSAVEVSDAHARAVDKSWYRGAGVMRGGQQFSLGTKAGRPCAACRRTWQAWTDTCNRCGAPV